MVRVMERRELREFRHTAGATPPLTAAQVRLRTLVLVRWLGVAGQTITILLVHFGLALELPLVPALSLVGASALLNIALGVGWPAAVRVSDRAATFQLAYDIVQLAGLLFLTGGLQNPFALLFLVPVTISATNLRLRSTAWLGALVVGCVTGLAFVFDPLPWPDKALSLPPLYLAGIWVALVFGTVFISAYAWRMAEEARRMQDGLAASQMALAREQKLSALGGLAAAAAHELGTPLGTIAVVAKELSREISADGPLGEDIALLVSQVDRCRHILAGLAQRPEDEGDRVFNRMLLSALAETAAAAHRRSGITLDILTDAAIADGGERCAEPVVPRSPEIIHGLGNLIENAVEFARSRVEIRVWWNGSDVGVTVVDDGPGMPGDVLDAIGEPYLTTRSGSGGMGLGVFIAKTLLERTGAILRFRNRPHGGAEVAIAWRRGILEPLETGPPSPGTAV